MTWTAETEDTAAWTVQGKLARTTSQTFTFKTVVTTNDAYLRSQNADYATAREGGTLQVFANNPYQRIGQTKVGASFNCYEAFIEFDTSSIPAGSTITAATLNFIEVNGKPEEDFTIEVREYDWSGGDTSTSIWKAGSDLSNYTLVASIDTSTWGASDERADFVSETALLSAIDISGISRFFLSSANHRAGTEPTLGLMGEEIWLGVRDESNDESPILTVTADVPTTVVPYSVQAEDSATWTATT